MSAVADRAHERLAGTGIAFPATGAEAAVPPAPAVKTTMAALEQEQQLSR